MTQLVALSKDIAGLGGEIVFNQVDSLGIRRIHVRFGNGYGASIIGGGGIGELIGSASAEGAVLAFDEHGDSESVYDTDVTDDVERFHEVSDLVEFVTRIAELPPRRTAVEE